MASLLSPSSLSISIYHFPRSKSNNLFMLLSPVNPQLAVLRISTRPQFKSSVHRISTPQSLLLSIAKGSALFIVGSFLFLAQFNLKLVLATVLPQSSSISSPLEEKSKTQNDKKGKEEKNEKKVENGDELVEMYERYLEKSPMDIEALKIVLFGKLRKLKMEEVLRYIERLIDIEKLVVALPSNLVAVLLSPNDGDRDLAYVLRGARLLYTPSDVASRHTKLEQVLLDDVKVLVQVMDLVFFTLIVLSHR